MSGFNGCNAFSGLYTIGADGSIRFFQMIHTERACREKEGRLEFLFSQVFSGAERFRREGNRLVIEAPSSGIRLFFIRLPDGGS